MKQIALFSAHWEVWGHAKNLCPAPRSVRDRRACNGHVDYDMGLGYYYICRVCGQMSTPNEVKGLEPWRGDL